jgi:hypothetical protein
MAYSPTYQQQRALQAIKSGSFNRNDDTAALVERAGEMSNFSVEDLREFAGMM